MRRPRSMVMGRPKKNRKKAPEEKIKKGVKLLTKAGVTMHYSVCGRPNHNKKGHAKFVERQLLEQRQVHGDDEDFDIPEIVEHIIPHPPDPTRDPTHEVSSMVYTLGQEERANVPISRVLGPLPDNAFIAAAARDSIPSAPVRVTTASTRGNLRGRGRGSSRGRKKRSAKEASTSAQSGHAQTAQGQAQAGQGHAAVALNQAQGGMNQPQGSLNQPQDEALGYNTGPGSMYYMLFGNDKEGRELPDLNAEVVPDENVQEFALSQNAPNYDDT